MEMDEKKREKESKLLSRHLRMIFWSKRQNPKSIRLSFQVELQKADFFSGIFSPNL